MDLRPDGGVNGGEIVAEGPPEAIAAEPKSVTGQYLRPLLERAPVRPELVEGRKAGAQPKSKTRLSRAKSRDAEADQPDLIAAK